MSCAECDRPAKARGLCDPHWKVHWRAGALDNYSKKPSKYDSILEDLKHVGFDDRLPIDPQLKEFAPRVGVTYHALEKAYYRRRRAQGYITPPREPINDDQVLTLAQGGASIAEIARTVSASRKSITKRVPWAAWDSETTSAWAKFIEEHKREGKIFNDFL